MTISFQIKLFDKILNLSPYLSSIPLFLAFLINNGRDIIQQQLASIALQSILNYIFKQKRPQSDEYGMPSNHSCFFVDFGPQQIFTICLEIITLFVCAQRITSNYHTKEQVTAGCITGGIISLLWFWIDQYYFDFKLEKYLIKEQFQVQIEGEDCPICSLHPNDIVNGVVATFSCKHSICLNCFYKSCVLNHSQACPLCKLSSKVIFIHNHSTQAPIYRHFNNTDWERERQLSNAFVEKNTNVQKTIQQLLNPPCPICQEQLSSFQELQSHVTDKHNLYYCNSCLRGAKFLPQEQPLYDRMKLMEHIKTHQKCPLCNQTFYDDEEFKNHLIQHRKCELCKEMYGIKDAYFRDDKALKEHYKQAHIVCQYTGCLNNMIAFENRRELAKHMLEDHANFLSAKEIVRWQQELDDQQNEVHTIDLAEADQYTQLYSLKSLLENRSKNVLQQKYQQQEQENKADELGHHYESYIEPPVQQYRGLVKKNKRTTQVNQDHLVDDTAQNVQNQQYVDDDELIIKKKKQRTSKIVLRKQTAINNEEEVQQSQNITNDFLSDIMGTTSQQNKTVVYIKQPGIQIQVQQQNNNIFNTNQEDDDFIVHKKKQQKVNKQQLRRQYQKEREQLLAEMNQQTQEQEVQQTVQEVPQQKKQYIQIQVANNNQNQQIQQISDDDELIVKKAKQPRKQKQRQIVRDHQYEDTVQQTQQVQQKEQQEEQKPEIKQYIKIQPTNEQAQYKQKEIIVYQDDDDLTVVDKKQKCGQKQKQQLKSQQKQIIQPQIVQEVKKIEPEEPQVEIDENGEQFVLVTSNIFKKQLNEILCCRYVGDVQVEQMKWTEKQLEQIKEEDMEEIEVQDGLLINNAIQKFVSNKQMQIKNYYQNKCQIKSLHEYNRKQLHYIFVLNKQDQQLMNLINVNQNVVIRLPASLVNKKGRILDFNETPCEQQINQINISGLLQKLDMYKQKYEENVKQHPEQYQLNTQDEDSDDDLPPGLF